jgi:hypothetical protein
MANLFQKLEIEAFRAGITPRTKESMAWFRQKATELGRIGPNTVMNDDAITMKTNVDTTSLKGLDQPLGNMYMYYYDPKHKETLPYYDRFPLIIMYGKAKGGFYGLNLHYMAPPLRAKALDAILGDGSLPGKYVKPMIKHYLFEHVKSRFALVDKPEWEIATFLPLAQWEKARASTVYAESRRKMR